MEKLNKGTYTTLLKKPEKLKFFHTEFSDN